MKISKWFHRGTPLISSLASLGSAGVTACTGGVCSVAAQGGSALLAGTSSSLSGFTSLAASSTGLPSWMTAVTAPSATPLPLPWWLKLIIMALMASVFFTIYGLSGKPRWAVLAGLAGILCIVSDLGWLSGGPAGMDAGLGLGVPVLVLAPWLARTAPTPRWNRWLRISLVGGALLASAMTLYLQFGMGWMPCLDCWGERFFLWAYALLGCGFLGAAYLGAGLRLSTVFNGFAVLALGGYLISFLQLLEVEHAQAVSRLVTLCGRTGPSCAQAGGQLFLGIPIVYFSLGLFGLLFTGSLVAGKQSSVTGH